MAMMGVDTNSLQADSWTKLIHLVQGSTIVQFYVRQTDRVSSALTMALMTTE